MALKIARARPPQAPRVRVSLCMIVRNEERFLEDCLESVKGLVDEFILVDTGSSDATLDLAERFGARIFHFPWIGDFAAARNESLQHATGEWILVMDADERLARGVPAALRERLDDPQVVGYSLINEHHCGSRGQTTLQLSSVFKLWRNGLGIHYEGAIHEQAQHVAERHGPVVQLDLRVPHLGFLAENISGRDKLERNQRIMEKQILEQPTNVHLRCHLAQNLMAMARYDQAQAHFETARAIILEDHYDPMFPFVAQVYFGLAETYRLSGQLERNQETCREAIALFPEHPGMPFSAGFALMDAGRPAEAIPCFERCLSLKGHYHQGGYDTTISGFRGLNALGVCHAMLGDRPQAIRRFREAIAETPEHDANIHANLGVQLLLEHRYREAEGEFEEATRRDPALLTAWINLGALRALALDVAGAVAAWDQALALAPDQSELRARRDAARATLVS